MVLTTSIPIRCRRAFVGLALCLAFSACRLAPSSGPTVALIPSIRPTTRLSPIPTTDPHQTWSTNFGGVTDLAASGISPHENSTALDMANVNSGGKSVKAFGTIGAAGSGLTVSFWLPVLAGAETVDLTDKTLDMDLYLPDDSPIFGFFITVFGDPGYVQVRFAHASTTKGQWRTYAVDIKQVVALQTWRTDRWTSPGLTDAQAVEVLRNAREISIYGMVMKERPLAKSYFLIDRLGWKPSGPFPSYDSSVDSLRKYAEARNLPFGGLMEPEGVSDPEYLRTFIQEFNTTLGWSRFPDVEPSEGAYSFDESLNRTPYADYMNVHNKFKIIRYFFGDADWVPAWLPKKSYEDTKVVLSRYTSALADYYRGRTYIWIVFNEALRYDIPYQGYTGLGLKDRNQTPQTWYKSYSPFSKDPSDVALIEKAFHAAREADPDALLFLNEPSVEEMGTAKAEAYYALVTRLVADGTPIDGVGFECHFNLRPDGNFYTEVYKLAFDSEQGFTGVAANVERFRELGLKVAFTEVDLSVFVSDIDTTPRGQALLEKRRKLQADGYRSLLHIALTHNNVAAVNLFDWADQYSRDDPERGGWYSLEGYGNEIGLFDWYFEKKPSYDAVLAELKGSP
jgi:endo-1,4-beta-xylanase